MRTSIITLIVLGISTVHAQTIRAVPVNAEAETSTINQKEMAEAWSALIKDINLKLSTIDTIFIRSDGMLRPNSGYRFDPLIAIEEIQRAEIELNSARTQMKALQGLGASQLKNFQDTEKRIQEISISLEARSDRVKPYREAFESFQAKQRMYLDLQKEEELARTYIDQGHLKQAQEQIDKLKSMEFSIAAYETIIPEEMKPLFESRDDYNNFKFNVAARLENPPSQKIQKELAERDPVAIPVPKSKKQSRDELLNSISDKVLIVTGAAVVGGSIVLYYREILESIHDNLGKLKKLKELHGKVSDPKAVREIEKEILRTEKEIRAHRNELAGLEKEELQRLDEQIKQLEREIASLEADLNFVNRAENLTLGQRLARIISNLDKTSLDKISAELARYFEEEPVKMKARLVAEEFPNLDQLRFIRGNIQELLGQLDGLNQEEKQLRADFRHNYQVVRNLESIEFADRAPTHTKQTLGDTFQAEMNAIEKARSSLQSKLKPLKGFDNLLSQATAPVIERSLVARKADLFALKNFAAGINHGERNIVDAYHPSAELFLDAHGNMRAKVPGDLRPTSPESIHAITNNSRGLYRTIGNRKIDLTLKKIRDASARLNTHRQKLREQNRPVESSRFRINPERLVLDISPRQNPTLHGEADRNVGGYSERGWSHNPPVDAAPGNEEFELRAVGAYIGEQEPIGKKCPGMLSELASKLRGAMSPLPKKYDI